MPLTLLAESPATCTTIEEVGSTGVGAMTIGFLILLVSTVVFILKSYPGGSTRKYYYCTAYICGFAAVSYLAMLSGQGWMAITGCRQFFYARYIDYFITTNIIILLLGMLSEASTELIAGAVGADCIWIFASFLGSASVVTEVKWLWFFINVGALVVVVHHITVLFKQSAEAKGGEIFELYNKLCWLTALCWLCYPVVWLFSEGFASFSVSFEVVAYTILDMISKVGLSFMVMSAHDAISSQGGEALNYA